jgi:hypothetical protein
MAIITISRQIGSFGDEIAQRAADELGYVLLDKKKINEIITDYSSDFSREVSVLTDESKPGFFDRFLYQQSVYCNLLSSIIYDAASKDKIVIVGRGGQFLLTDQPTVLHARIIAPLALRISRCIEQERIKEKLAEDIVRKNDRKRTEFIRYLYQAEVSDPKWYDIIINTGKFDIQSSIDILVKKARLLENEQRANDDAKNAFKALALRKRVEATLQKEMPDSNHIKVKADIDGTVSISGYISTDVEKTQAEQHTASVQGVQKVENLLQVAYFPVTTWP